MRTTRSPFLWAYGNTGFKKLHIAVSKSWKVSAVSGHIGPGMGILALDTPTPSSQLSAAVTSQALSIRLTGILML
jgi:hypothetical protein